MVVIGISIARPIAPEGCSRCAGRVTTGLARQERPAGWTRRSRGRGQRTRSPPFGGAPSRRWPVSRTARGPGHPGEDPERTRVGTLADYTGVGTRRMSRRAGRWVDGGPRASPRVRRRCARIWSTTAPSVMKARIRIAPPQAGHVSGSTSYRCAAAAPPSAPGSDRAARAGPPRRSAPAICSQPAD